MSDHLRRREADDTEGHALRFNGADAERDEADDTEGHIGRWGYDAAAEDDVEGRRVDARD